MTWITRVCSVASWVGRPLILPDEGSKDKPAGSDPDATEKTNDTSEMEGRAEKASPRAIVKGLSGYWNDVMASKTEKTRVVVRFPAMFHICSVTERDGTTSVGAPEMTPEVALRRSPAGKEPERNAKERKAPFTEGAV